MSDPSLVIKGVSRPTSFGQQIGAVEVNTQANGDISGVRTINLAPYPPSGGSLPTGTTVDSTLRYDGSAWVENTAVKSDASGFLTAAGMDSTTAFALTADGQLLIRSDGDDVVISAETVGKSVFVEGVEFRAGKILNSVTRVTQNFLASAVTSGNAKVVPTNDTTGFCARLIWEKGFSDNQWRVTMNIYALVAYTGPHYKADTAFTFLISGSPHVTGTTGRYVDSSMSFAGGPWTSTASTPIQMPVYTPSDLSDLSGSFDPLFNSPFAGGVAGYIIRPYNDPSPDAVIFRWTFTVTE